MKQIVIASSNAGKIREFKEMLEPKGYTVISQNELGDVGEADETGTTFRENAVIKAAYITNKFGIPAIADDSGLEIDAFGGEPGVYSARFLGHDTPYEYKNRIILERMENEKVRTCRYVCAIAYTEPGKDPVVFEDTCECLIARDAKGENGFGYDPIIYYEPLHKTMAEMTKDEKNAISHRGKALVKLENWLNEDH